jgi:hypothetical protein
MQYQNFWLKNIDRLILNRLHHPIVVIVQNLFNATSVLRVSEHLIFTTTADIAMIEIGIFARIIEWEVPSIRKRRMF